MEFIQSIYDRQTSSSRFSGKYLGISDNGIVQSFIKKLQCHRIDEHSVMSRCGDIEEYLEDESLMVPPFACKFCQVPGKENILAVANEEGEVQIMNTDLHGQSAYIKALACHRNAIFDISWAPNEFKLITASGDKTAILWNLQDGKAIKVCKGHTGSIKAVQFQPGSNDVFATGARDGCIMLWDFRSHSAIAKLEGGYQYSCCRPDDIIRNAHSFVDQKLLSNSKTKRKQLLLQDNAQSITAITYQNESTLITAGPSDGLIKVWDLRKHYSLIKKDPYPKYTFKYCGKSIKNQGFSSLTMDSRNCYLFANCTDNIIYQYDCCSYDSSPVAVFNGYENFSFFVRSTLSPDDKYLISGSSDNNAYIWKVDSPSSPLYKLEGHQAEVTNVAWCNSPIPRIVTCADDMKLKIWNVKDEDKLEDEMSITGKVIKMRDVSSRYDNLKSRINPRSLVTHVPGKLNEEFTFQTNCTLQRTPSGKNILKSNFDIADCSIYGKYSSSRSPPSLMQWISPEDKRNTFNRKISMTFTFENNTNSAAFDQENIFSNNRQGMRNVGSALSPSKTFSAENIIKSGKASRSLFDDKSSEQTSILQENTENITSSTYLSPTINLPNLVVDSTTPKNTLSEKIALKSKKRHKDWLTEMSASFKPKLQMKSKEKISKSYQSPRAMKRKKSSKSSSPKGCHRVSMCSRKQDILQFFSPATQ